MDELIKKAIENELIRKPSPGFSDKVMNRVFKLPRFTKVEPIISWKGWIVISLFSVSVIYGIIRSVSPTESQYNKVIADASAALTGWLHNFFLSFGNIRNLSMLVAILVSILILLSLDFIMNRKRA